MPIEASNALYIKLGESGIWESDCIRDGTLRLGYRDLPHELCSPDRWEEAVEEARKWSKDQGAATRHVNQVRLFYETDHSTLWITFHADRLWWCFARPEVSLLGDGTRVRRVIEHWHDSDVQGRPLLKAYLSGKLLAVQGFQGTICSVSDLSYVLHKVNATVAPHVAAAQAALDALQGTLVPMIQSLHPKDFEVFADLIFRQAGWQRSGVVGGVERDIDLDLISPVTDERIGVQVKSRASMAEYTDYRQRYADMRGFTRFYFITHSPTRELAETAARLGDVTFVYWGPQELARLAGRHGLVGWLIDRAS